MSIKSRNVNRLYVSSIPTPAWFSKPAGAFCSAVAQSVFGPPPFTGVGSIW